jgi:hypothetical protein
MSSVLQLEEVALVRASDDGPKLLVEWSSRWENFVTSIKPALERSQRRLAGEAPFGLIPFRIMAPSYVIEAFLIMAAIFIKVKVDELRPYVAPRLSSHDVIYYTGDELPRTEDLGGAQTGKSGQAGGEEAHHRTQTIKIARGGSLVEQVVDAPNVKLPSSNGAVANLLAVKPDPGPPPSQGLRSTRSAPNLATTVVAPAPNVIHDYTRNGVQLDSVIAPAPNVTRDRALTAPSYNATMIPPAPSVTDEHRLVAPALTPAIIAPAPRVTRDRSLTAPTLNTSVVAPAPNISRDRSRSAPALSSNVIPPAPGAVSRQISSAPVQMDSNVVPPPVSAPERATSAHPKLTLPAPNVVAPPPSADLSTDMRRMAGGSVPDPGRTVVPPPPSQSGSGIMSSIIGRIFGASDVVPPPPNVNTASNNSGSRATLPNNVVAPPPTVNANNSGGEARGSRTGSGASLGNNVVAPPPSVGATGGTGTQGRGAAPYMGNPGIVPPPPSLAGAGGGTGTTGGGNGAAGGTLLANNIVPPPPSVGGGSNANGSGSGRKGVGLGAPNDVGAGLSPATNGGAGANAGAVISSQPGSKVGLPTSGGTGSLAMSPSGNDKTGLGGAGGGTGIGHGEGPGSGLSGEGTGAAKIGPGRGSDPNARGGISPTAGPGGAGTMSTGTPTVRGVDISGGSGVVTLPGFGSDPATSEPATPGRSTAKARGELGVTIVATANSGGAFEPYKNLLRGEKYTTYFDTSLGTAVMEFADESTSAHPFGGTLSAPVSIRTDLPDGLPRARMVVACSLDTAGNLKIIRVLEPGPAAMTAKVVAALRGWKFQPAMRGQQAVEVTAILGFGIDTNDRF